MSGGRLGGDRGTIISQSDWRKAKEEKIHRLYEEYQKPNFPREIQGSKLDESSAKDFPRDLWSISQAKGSTIPRAI